MQCLHSVRWEKTCMNMPPPMHHNAFDNINYHLQEAYLKQCQESMLHAADEIRNNEFGDDMDGKASNITCQKCKYYENSKHSNCEQYEYLMGQHPQVKWKVMQLLNA